MYIAHLPGGYILSRIAPGLKTPALLLGSIAPDFDMALVWFAGMHVHHHEFLTHRPFFWLSIAIAALVVRTHWVLSFAVGGILHVSLDSLAGRIDWAWPFGSYVLGLITVPRHPMGWQIAFLTHPVFLLEIGICCVAAVMFWIKRKAPGPS